MNIFTKNTKRHMKLADIRANEVAENNCGELFTQVECNGKAKPTIYPLVCKQLCEMNGTSILSRLVSLKTSDTILHSIQNK